MKKCLVCFLGLLLCLSAAFAESGPVPAELRLKEDSLTVSKGASRRIELELLPEDADPSALVWKSANPRIARVSTDGTVTGVLVGATTITCAARDGSGLSASVTVRVFHGVSSLTFRPESLSLMIGETAETALRIRPGDAPDPSVRYASSDESVASVSSDGTVRGRAAGVCTVTASAQDGSGVTASLPVRVEPIASVRISGTDWKAAQDGFHLILRVENLSEQRKIRAFDYTVRCIRDPETVLALEYLRYSGPNLLPGRTEESASTVYAIHRAEEAERIEITPIRICFMDGTTLNIPLEYRETVSVEGPER